MSKSLTPERRALLEAIANDIRVSNKYLASRGLALDITDPDDLIHIGDMIGVDTSRKTPGRICDLLVAWDDAEQHKARLLAGAFKAPPPGQLLAEPDIDDLRGPLSIASWSKIHGRGERQTRTWLNSKKAKGLAVKDGQKWKVHRSVLSAKQASEVEELMLQESEQIGKKRKKSATTKRKVARRA